MSNTNQEKITELQKEIDANFQEFQKISPEALHGEANRWALMRHGKCVGFYDTLRDADTAGKTLYEDGLFSVQQVQATVVDLGWFSHAMH